MLVLEKSLGVLALANGRDYFCGGGGAPLGLPVWVPARSGEVRCGGSPIYYTTLFFFLPTFIQLHTVWIKHLIELEKNLDCNTEWRNKSFPVPSALAGGAWNYKTKCCPICNLNFLRNAELLDVDFQRGWNEIYVCRISMFGCVYACRIMGMIGLAWCIRWSSGALCGREFIGECRRPLMEDHSPPEGAGIWCRPRQGNATNASYNLLLKGNHFLFD